MNWETKSIITISNKDMISHILPDEVMAHNQLGDVWVSLFGWVIDVSDVAHPTKCASAQFIFAYAGKDVSHLFDLVSEPVDPDLVPLPALAPLPPLVGKQGVRWWRDPSRVMGKLSNRPRPIRLIDMINGFQVTLTVCGEDTGHRILERYKLFNNFEMDSYTCVYEDRPLDLDKTLEENGVRDQREMFVSVGLPEDFYVPALLLYFRS